MVATRSWGWGPSRLVLGVVAFSLWLAAPAHAFVYWSNQKASSASLAAIGRAGNDGSAPNQDFAPFDGAPASVAVDAGHVYWLDSGAQKIGRANIDGASPDPNFMTGITANRIAVDGSHIYWVTEGTYGSASSKIGRANINGTLPNPNFITGITWAHGLAVDGAHIYWTRTDYDASGAGTASVARANLDGTGVDESFSPIPGPDDPTDVAVDGAHIYWSSSDHVQRGPPNTNTSAIGRANINGSAPNGSFIPLDRYSFPTGIASDGTHIYWTETHPSPTRTVARANVDGTALDESFISATRNAGTVAATPSALIVNDAGDGEDALKGDGTCADANGKCTLRAAIEEANALAGKQTVDFAIPGVGVPTIAPGSALPAITEPVDLAGTTQPGGWVHLSGVGAGSVSGLVVQGGQSVVNGFVVGGFGAGAGVLVQGGGVDRIEGDRIGTDVAGAAADPNDVGVRVEGASGTVVGGDAAAAGNVISGNSGAGVELAGSATSHVSVVGNVIGTDAAATFPVHNFSGVRVLRGPGNTIVRNVISGNISDGVEVLGETPGTVIKGNMIGVDRAGDDKHQVGNGENGIRAHLNAQHTIIGGPGIGEGNEIANNGKNGVLVQSVFDGDPTIQGNLIGRDAAGTPIGLGNDGSGILLENVSTVSFGGISALIGGSAPGEGNRIGTNAHEGIALDGQVTNVRVQGNEIRNANLEGVTLNSADRNLIGGTGPGEGNTIINSGLQGVLVLYGSGNSILGNAISGSGDLYAHPRDLGIDLASTGTDRGVTPNDAGDVDKGANGLQNFPDLAGAIGSSNHARVVGSMNSRPKTRYAVELFASAVCDPSGFGEGQRVLRSFNVTTDRAGVGMIDTRLSLPPGHPVITATATAAEGTSEFSACLKPGGTNTVSAAIAPAGLTPDSSGHVTVDVWCLDKKPCDGTATLQQVGSSPRAAARSAHPIAATASSRTLGSGRFHGRRGGRALKVRIRLTASGKRILAKRKRLNVVAKVKLKGRHGHSAQDSVSFVLAARRRH